MERSDLVTRLPYIGDDFQYDGTKEGEMAVQIAHSDHVTRAHMRRSTDEIRVRANVSGISGIARQADWAGISAFRQDLDRTSGGTRKMTGINYRED